MRPLPFRSFPVLVAFVVSAGVSAPARAEGPPPSAAPASEPGASGTVSEVVPAPPTPLEAAVQPKPEFLSAPGLIGLFSYQVVGLTGGYTETTHPPGGSNAVTTFGAGQSADLLLSDPRSISLRYHTRAGLSGGGGLAGRYEALLAAGPYLGNRTFAGVPRLGFGGAYQASARFKRAHFVLPRFDLAALVRPAPWLSFELGVTGGYVIDGRFNTDGLKRRTGGRGQLGAFFAVAIHRFAATVQATRDRVEGLQNVAVDTVDANGCVMAITPVSLCANYTMGKSAGAGAEGPAEFGARVLQISLGVGRVAAQ